MAIIRGQAGEEPDRVVLGQDDENGEDAIVLVCAVPEPEERKIREKYGREKDVDVPFEKGEDKGFAVVRQRVQSPEEFRQIQRDIAKKGWAGQENFGIRPTTPEEADTYTRLSKKAAGGPIEFEVGKTRYLAGGELSEELKFYLLDNDTPLAKIVAERALEKSKRRYAKEGDLRGN